MWSILIQKSCNPFTRISNFDRKDIRGKTRCYIQKYIDDFKILDRFEKRHAMLCETLPILTLKTVLLFQKLLTLF